MELSGHVIADIIGTPEDHVRQAADLLVKKLQEDETLSVENIQLHDPVTEEGVTSILIEYDAHFPSFERYVTFLIEYMPASVEITDPETVTLQAADFNTFTGEFLAYLHEYDKAVKQKLAEQAILEKKFDQLMRNLILVGLGKDTLPKEALAKRIGIDVKSLTPYLFSLVRQGVLSYTPQGYRVRNA